MGSASTNCCTSTQGHWWHDTVGYVIYIRSFADANGDGVGDLAGIINHLDHLVELGVNLVWVSPFYPSPMADFGYDVADYCSVDPMFGNFEDLDHLISEVHRRDIRLIVDLVPNHTSVEHEWFKNARSQPAGVHRDYYVWSDPGPDGGVPNNWVSYFGGPAWTLDDATGQYYLHLFLDDQPDLNWRNPAVHEEFERILRFWLDRGVDGFRVDVAQGLVKDAQLRSNPQVGSWDPAMSRSEQWDAFDHLHDVCQPETLGIYERWRTICAEYDAVLIGETHVLTADEFAFLLPGTGLDVGFWFPPMDARWEAEELAKTLREPLNSVPGMRSIGWMASSLDQVRPATRFGGGDPGRRRALALATLLFCLPGLPFLYQGEELGLLEGMVPPDRRADPVGLDVGTSRDGCRTPIPWKPGPTFGFSSAADTWLPDGGRRDSDTAFVQRKAPGSWLDRYSALVRLRRTEQALGNGSLAWLDLGVHEVIAFQRGDHLVVLANISERYVHVGVSGSVLFTTHDKLQSSRGGMKLAPAQAVVVRT